MEIGAADVLQLSDNEEDVIPGSAQPSSASSQCIRPVNELSDAETFEVPKKRKSRAKELDGKEVSEQFRRLRIAASRRCKCKTRNCGHAFKDDPTLLADVHQQRMMLLELPKHESDRAVPSTQIISELVAGNQFRFICQYDVNCEGTTPR